MCRTEGKILIINADDFGYSQSVNPGVVESHANGVVTSASWMANGDAADEAKCLADDHPQLDVGLHLCLNETGPLIHPEVIAPLLDEDSFPARYTSTIGRLLVRPTLLGAVEAEWRAQYERYVHTWSRVPVHVDSHQHIAMFPFLWEIFLRLALQFGVHFVRLPDEMQGRPRHAFARRRWVSAHALSILSRIYRKRLESVGLRTTNGFLGFRASGRLDEGSCKTLISSMSCGVTEMMVHPGTTDEQNGYHRSREMNVLTSVAIQTVLKESGVSLASFRDLL